MFFGPEATVSDLSLMTVVVSECAGLARMGGLGPDLSALSLLSQDSLATVLRAVPGRKQLVGCLACLACLACLGSNGCPVSWDPGPRTLV